MNKDQFKNNLIMCVSELGVYDCSNLKFKIIPVVENGKNLNSIDDYMRLTILNKNNIEGRLLDLDRVVNYLSGPHSTFPIWINTRVINDESAENIIELKVSQRFRKPSLLRYQETGHPPFKAILKE